MGFIHSRSLPGNAGAPAALVYGGDDSHSRQDIAVRSWRTWG